MSSCNGNCSSCSSGSCADRKKESLLASLNPKSTVKKVIAVVSGKGGVGKSTVTCSLAAAMAARGKKVGVLDADITGPSVPKAFGIHYRANGYEDAILPVETATGIQLMSVNLLLENETDPVVWRGPVIAGAVEQFWTDVIWGDLDYLFIDMPPGTGDVPLTVFQSIALDGIIIVTTPQDLVSMIVDKAVKMAQKMNVPILGIVENMSYFKCSDCGKIHKIFGDSNIDAIAEKHNIPVVCKLPINPDVAAKCDRGAAEEYEGEWLDPMIDFLEKMD